MKSPIFIIGTARSGTTLLCSMLTAHPDIFIKNELFNICNIFTKNDSVEKILEAVNRAMRDVYGCDLHTFLQQNEKKRWGIKDPSITYCLEPIHKHFPDAKMIFIIRDGRAVANSYIGTGWGIATNVYYGAKRWKHEIKIQREFIKNHAEKCHVVKYENLITNTEKELKDICCFIEEPYTEQMSQYDRQKSFIKKTELNKNIFRSLDEKLVSKYREELSPFQINIFETVAGDVLVENQYELIGKQITIPKPLELWFYLHQRIFGELQLQYRLRFIKFKKMFQKSLKNDG